MRPENLISGSSLLVFGGDQGRRCRHGDPFNLSETCHQQTRLRVRPSMSWPTPVEALTIRGLRAGLPRGAGVVAVPSILQLIPPLNPRAAQCGADEWSALAAGARRGRGYEIHNSAYFLNGEMPKLFLFVLLFSCCAFGGTDGLA